MLDGVATLAIAVAAFVVIARAYIVWSDPHRNEKRRASREEKNSWKKWEWPN